jgi:hypothetical protein
LDPPIEGGYPPHTGGGAYRGGVPPPKRACEVKVFSFLGLKSPFNFLDFGLDQGGLLGQKFGFWVLGPFLRSVEWTLAVFDLMRPIGGGTPPL